MTEGVTVRQVRPDEHGELARLTIAVYRVVLGDLLDGEYLAELADVAGRAELAEVLVAVDASGTLLGTITYLPGPGPLAWFDGPDEAGLRILAVTPDAQRRGVGSALVAECVARAIAAGKRRILLHTTPSMSAAHRLYERAGFRRDPDRDEWYGELHLLAYVLDLDGR